MLNGAATGLLIALVLGAGGPAQSQAQRTPSDSERRPRVAPAQPSTGSAPPELKAVFWYRKADPPASFRFELYDLRKGQYDGQAVGRWLKTVADGFPGYTAYVRDIDLARERGRTESEKVKGVIVRELVRVIGPDIPLLPLQTGGPTPREGRPLRSARIGGLPGAGGLGAFGGALGPTQRLPGSDRSLFFPPPALFPVPYPYPRPHP